MHKKTSVWISVAALVVGTFIGFSFGAQSAKVLPESAAVQSAGDASIMIDYGDGRVNLIHDVALEDGMSMLAYMKKAASEKSLTFETKDYEGLGSLVTKIGEKENGADKKYWQFWVNNISPEVGASQFVVKNGDVIEWKFLQYQEE